MPSAPKPVCVDCQVSFKVEEIGVTVCFMYADPPRPYQLYQADTLKCPGCGKIIVGAWADRCTANHDEDFEKELERARKYPEKLIYVYERPVPAQPESDP